MSAILTARLLRLHAGSPDAGSPDAGSPGAGSSPAPRLYRRSSLHLSETLRMMWGAACEGLLLLWMFAVVAFCLLMAAGAGGLLG